MDNDRASVRCCDREVSVRVIAVVLGQWRDDRGRCREVAKKPRVSFACKLEGRVIGVRHAWLDAGELIRDSELVVFSVGRWYRERGEQNHCRRRGDERARGCKAQM